jgi:type III restriction enzyme
MFIEQCIPLIKNAIYEFEIDGIRYMKLDGEEYYLQEIFDSAELIANLDKNAVAVDHSVYDHIIYDSGTVERPFAVALDDDPDVRMFFKIPKRFKIETPLGTYNPDWAVYLEQGGVKKLYFVLETKGSTSRLDLRGKEDLKIHCGQAHFAALENDVELRVGTNWKGVKISI